MSSSNCCMICHDEVDKSGNYPVRNCSCRGTSGHVHFECLVEGLRKKDKFDLFDWTNCSLCKQGYYDTFEVDLILTCQDHVIQKFGTESKHYILVQIRKLQMTYFQVSKRDHRLDSREAITATIENIESFLARLEKSYPITKVGRFIDKHRAILFNYRAVVKWNSDPLVKAQWKKGYIQMSKAQKLYAQLGLNIELAVAQQQEYFFRTVYVSEFGTRSCFGDHPSIEEAVDLFGRIYNHFKANLVDGDVQLLYYGELYVQILVRASRIIEAWRLTNDIRTEYLRCHGPDHPTISSIMKLFEYFIVNVMILNMTGVYKVVSYQDEKYVVNGPFTEDGKKSNQITVL
eukprot:scaffold127412_cov99-Cyclotella_meneghiniana.AAC.1